MDTMEKLELLADAAKYDAACTSSGVRRYGEKGSLGAASAAGCCHSFAADGRCITLLKVLFTNYCRHDCAYCVNRRSNDVPRASFTPRELAELTCAFYRRNYIEGLFLSSGVVRDADYTTELLVETVRILREEMRFRGYVHAKAIPGTSPELLERLGGLVDRISINVELPSQASLDYLAPEKGGESVIAPMALLRDGIDESAEQRRLARRNYLKAKPPSFAPAGQSTQMIVGASPETDHHILQLTSALYSRFSLKRVFYSAYSPVNDDARLPGLDTAVPLTREHRLYQADWLLRYYGFSVDELLSPQHPDLDLLLDPKAHWALQHMDLFPLEVNRASYEELLRVPGLGVATARRIVAARRHRSMDFDQLKTLGLSLKRAGFFLACRGRMADGFTADPVLARASMERSSRASGAGRTGRKGLVEGQLALFDAGVQSAVDPFSRSGHGDRLLARARSRRIEAHEVTASGLPTCDPLLEVV